jgi:hypothetical protein
LSKQRKIRKKTKWVWHIKGEIIIRGTPTQIESISREQDRYLAAYTTKEAWHLFRKQIMRWYLIDDDEEVKQGEAEITQVKICNPDPKEAHFKQITLDF